MGVRNFIGFAFLLIVGATGAYGQSTLGFTSAQGFPQVITQGTHYDIGGWIINHGPMAFSGQLDIELRADSNNVLHLDNNFSSGFLQAGDSVYWSRNNFNFPPGHFRTGHNDVLIWPTVSTGSDVTSDSVGLVMYFTQNSAFRLLAPSSTPFAAGISLTSAYDFEMRAQNLSSEPNANDVCLYVKIPDREPRCISQAQGIYGLNQVAEFDRQLWSIWQEFNLQANDTLGAAIDMIEFYALEVGANEDPINRVAIPVLPSAVATVDAVTAGISVYPNPFSQILTIVVPQAWGEDAYVQLSDLSGRIVFAGALTQPQIHLGNVAAGSYILEVSSSQGIVHKQVLCR